MFTVFYSVQYILKSGGIQVAHMSGAEQTVFCGVALHNMVYDRCRQWYESNGEHPIDAVSVHIIALNKI